MALPIAFPRVFSHLRNSGLLSICRSKYTQSYARGPGKVPTTAHKFSNVSPLPSRFSASALLARSNISYAAGRLFSNLSSQRCSRPVQDSLGQTFSGSGHSRWSNGGRRNNSNKTERDAAEEAAHQAKMMKYSFIAFGATFSIGITTLVCDWGAPKLDDEGKAVEDLYSKYSLVPQYILRAYNEAMTFTKTIQEPSRLKLLPEPLTEPYIQPPYTLCLELTGVLVHPEWSYQTGWRFKKRPGVHFFLQQVGPPLFELVIYTQESGLTAYPIIDNLDPQGYVMYRLFKDATRYQDGHHIKDLGQLNRDMKRVILVDHNPSSFLLTPSNAVRMKKWGGNDDDRSLVDLAIFLRTIAESGVDDVRGVLEYYSQFDDPLGAFRENQRKLAEQEHQAAQVEHLKPVPAWSAFKRR